MIRINELIPQLNVQKEYQPIIDFLCDSVKKNVPNIHGVYMCGSIPKGLAIPYGSFINVIEKSIIFYKNEYKNISSSE